MDRVRFDALARALGASGSRRAAIAALLGAALLDLVPIALAKPGRRKSRGKGKRQGRGNRQQQRHRQERSASDDQDSAPADETSDAEEITGEAQASSAKRARRGGLHAAGNKKKAKKRRRRRRRRNRDRTPPCSGEACFCPEGQTLCNDGRCKICCNNGAPGPCGDGNVCCGNKCVNGDCCETRDCPGKTCHTKACVANQCQHTAISDDTGPSCADTCCSGVCCNRGEECDATGACDCDPDCFGKICGSDGCGGQCGPGCAANETCSNNGATCTCEHTNCDGECVIGTCCGVAEECCGAAQCPSSHPFCDNERCVACLEDSDCDALSGGTVRCNNGICNQLCDNPLFRICDSTCRECCNDHTQCHSIDEASTCVGGTCRCPNGLTRCGLECIDTSSEPNHCGQCNNSCASSACLNGECQPVESCGRTNCDPRHDPDCDLFISCPENKACSGGFRGTCSCPDGRVDCSGTGACESCGRCGVTCPDDPDTGLPGFCCDGGYCSCGGTCCPNSECWVVTRKDAEGTPISSYEHCGIEGSSTCVNCWGQCCTACINGECASSGPMSGGSLRRR